MVPPQHGLWSSQRVRPRHLNQNVWMLEIVYYLCWSVLEPQKKNGCSGRWMKVWVEKAESNTGPVKSHTFTCRDNPHKRKWKLTVYPEGEQQPSGVKEVNRSILEAYWSRVYYITKVGTCVVMIAIAAVVVRGKHILSTKEKQECVLLIINLCMIKWRI